VTLLGRDEEFGALSRGAEVTFALGSRGGGNVIVRVDDGTVEVGDDPEFVVELEESSWRELTAPHAAPGRQHVLAHLVPRGPGAVRGDQLAFAQHLHLVRRAVELLAGAGPARDAPGGTLAGVSGRYLTVNVAPWGECEVFAESAGTGRPVVLLHTAGADSRQFHGLLRLADRFAGRRLIAFDLPWHGRSGPGGNAGNLDYELTSESYAGCVAAVIAALELAEPPVIVGASMAGAAVLEVAARHPGTISGAVSCQAGPRVANRHNAWQRSPRVNQALFVPEWTFGLMSPHSPKAERDRVWWGYSQGGYGVYERDITYYTRCWDIDNILPLLNGDTPPLVLMSGAYDYSVPPEATRELAALLPKALYRDMPELGHFPHAENPAVFAGHLAWALAAIDDTAAIPPSSTR
jgi:pimeloyl-ACP methyl ester carboxylesterase